MARRTQLDRAIANLEADLRAEVEAHKGKIAVMQHAIDRLQRQKASEAAAKAEKGPDGS